MQIVLCIVCNTNPAQHDDFIGFLPCENCVKRQRKTQRPDSNIPEMTGEDIKTQRKMYFDDIHPAHRKGVASREFREKYGKQAMQRQGFSDEEIKNAVPVWNDDLPYSQDK